ncbi:MAG: alpha/beta hydrolase [Pseudomonadales bacterium]|nr:alpha/beta hydrolase [Halioglobus sp.]MCP5130817.1 alpha/beta hydrolase [Pseudomonadales bacterium]
MQSWQTDLLNLQLSLSIKPMLRHMDSIDRIRKLVAVSDRVVGRLALPRGTQREAVKIPGARFDAEWIGANDGTTRRVMLYLPGGAYVLRTPNIHAGMVSRLCKCANTRALMTYYRLAPEHPFPACLEDSVLAYRWLLDQGIAPENIIIAGDSAGGGLTLSTLLALKEQKLPMPACAYMLSPLLDVSDHAPSRWKNAASDTALPAPAQRAINPRPLYLGGSDPSDPMVSPINGNFAGLPPMYIQVSDSEMLLDDSLRLARRCHTYDVPVNVDIWRKVPHVWQAFAFLPESNEALEKAGHFIQQHIL